MKVTVIRPDGGRGTEDVPDSLARDLRREQRRAEKDRRLLERRAEVEAEAEEGRQRSARAVLEKLEAQEAEIADLRKDLTSNKGEITKLKNTIAALQKPA